MIVHNEYLGWQIEWPQTFQDTLTRVAVENEELWDNLRDFVHEMFPNVDTFHTDSVTFLWAFNSKEDARSCEKEIKRRVCHWLEAYW